MSLPRIAACLSVGLLIADNGRLTIAGWVGLALGGLALLGLMAQTLRRAPATNTGWFGPHQ